MTKIDVMRLERIIKSLLDRYAWDALSTSDEITERGVDEQARLLIDLLVEPQEKRLQFIEYYEGRKQDRRRYTIQRRDSTSARHKKFE